MANCREVKDFKYIERELSDLVEKEKGIVILDTGALIDLQRKSECKIFPCCGKNIERYLQGLDSLADVIITPATYQEVIKHSNIKKNGYRSELSSSALGKSLGYYEKFKEFYDQMHMPEKDMNGLDSWLLVKNHLEFLLNEADEDEIVSPTDAEILFYAANFSRTNLANEKEPRRTIVMTSDHNHVARGINILSQMEEFSKLKLLDTRK